jgi:hypothetical protein
MLPSQSINTPAYGAASSNGTTMVVVILFFDEEWFPLKLYYSYMEKTTVVYERVFSPTRYKNSEIKCYVCCK